MTKIVNLYGGPGTGKSTMMARLFTMAKAAGINCEMSHEFAKGKVWEGSLDVLDDQIYIFGKQVHSLHRLIGKVDVVFTDAPLLMSCVYGTNESPEFHALVKTVHARYHSLNIFLTRQKEYNPSGRVQSEKRAREYDDIILNMLREVTYNYHVLPAETSSAATILELLNVQSIAPRDEEIRSELF